MLNRPNKTLLLSQALALAASVLIAGQIGYTLYQGAPFCPNEGCKVVEKLTRVSPLVFNVAGFVFFQTIYWGMRAARSDMRRLPQFVRTLLLAGLAAEAVLTSFQFLVTQAFCAYCVAILAVVVVLNLLLGLKQIVPGVLVFVTVSLAFASLEFNPVLPGTLAFDAGVFATRPGVTKYPEHYLFYASTCPHCEKVIASLRTNNRVTVMFNPIDQVTNIDLPNTTRSDSYSPVANKALLTSLAIDEIPVLMTRTPEGWTIRRGESAILAALALPGRSDAVGQSGAPATPASSAAVPGVDRGDGCQVSSPDCTSTSPGQSFVR